MVITPSFVRQISVPRHEIVAVPRLDIPVFKDCSLACSVVEDCGDVHVPDLVVILVASCSDFWSSHQDVLELSTVVVGSNGIKELSKVFVLLNVESSIPLSVLGCKADLSWWSLHRKLRNDLLVQASRPGNFLISFSPFIL